jgi:hypothetical protein
MITLADYASFDSVRAALGVSDLEITDAALNLDIYAVFVQQELDGISATLRTEFEAINSPSGDPTLEAKYDAVRVFSAYAVAYKSSDSLPLSSPKVIVEGKASMSRHADSPYKFVIEEVRKNYIYWKKFLTNLIDETVDSTEAPTLLTISEPTYDPITGS